MDGLFLGAPHGPSLLLGGAAAGAHPPPAAPAAPGCDLDASRSGSPTKLRPTTPGAGLAGHALAAAALAGAGALAVPPPASVAKAWPSPPAGALRPAALHAPGWGAGLADVHDEALLAPGAPGPLAAPFVDDVADGVLAGLLDVAPLPFDGAAAAAAAAGAGALALPGVAAGALPGATLVGPLSPSPIGGGASMIALADLHASNDAWAVAGAADAAALAACLGVADVVAGAADAAAAAGGGSSGSGATAARSLSGRAAAGSAGGPAGSAEAEGSGVGPAVGDESAECPAGAAGEDAGEDDDPLVTPEGVRALRALPPEPDAALAAAAAPAAAAAAVAAAAAAAAGGGAPRRLGPLGPARRPPQPLPPSYQPGVAEGRARRLPGAGALLASSEPFRRFLDALRRPAPPSGGLLEAGGRLLRLGRFLRGDARPAAVDAALEAAAAAPRLEALCLAGLEGALGDAQLASLARLLAGGRVWALRLGPLAVAALGGAPCDTAAPAGGYGATPEAWRRLAADLAGGAVTHLELRAAPPPPAAAGGAAAAAARGARAAARAAAGAAPPAEAADLEAALAGAAAANAAGLAQPPVPPLDPELLAAMGAGWAAGAAGAAAAGGRPAGRRGAPPPRRRAAYGNLGDTSDDDDDGDAAGGDDDDDGDYHCGGGGAGGGAPARASRRLQQRSSRPAAARRARAAAADADFAPPSADERGDADGDDDDLPDAGAADDASDDPDAGARRRGGGAARWRAAPPPPPPPPAKRPKPAAAPGAPPAPRPGPVGTAGRKPPVPRGGSAARRIPAANQRIRACSARADLKGKPSFSELVDSGLMAPGAYRFAVGNAEVAASVGPDGAITYAGQRYRAISKFALVVLRERNPARQSCDGWKEVAWNGEKLDALRARLGGAVRTAARR